MPVGANRTANPASDSSGRSEERRSQWRSGRLSSTASHSLTRGRADHTAHRMRRRATYGGGCAPKRPGREPPTHTARGPRRASHNISVPCPLRAHPCVIVSSLTIVPGSADVFYASTMHTCSAPADLYRNGCVRRKQLASMVTIGSTIVIVVVVSNTLLLVAILMLLRSQRRHEHPVAAEWMEKLARIDERIVLSSESLEKLARAAAVSGLTEVPRQITKATRLLQQEQKSVSVAHEDDPSPRVWNSRTPNPVEAYNTALADENGQGAFCRLFPGHYIAVTNAEKRMRQPGGSVELGVIDHGDFYAFLCPSSADMYNVVPRIGRQLNRIRFEAGGWREMFECRQYRGEDVCGRMRLVEPAVLRNKNGQWSIARRGVVQFG